MSGESRSFPSLKAVKQTLLSFPNHLAHGYNQGKSLALPSTYRSVQRILFTGVGGSGIGGQMAKQMVRNRLPVPFEIISSLPLPHFVDQNTLVILSSYSGNTRETLGVAQAVKRRGLKAVALTSGGELGVLFSKEPVLSLPPGFQPRCALGYLLGNLLGLLENLFPQLELQKEVDEATSLLQDLLPHDDTFEEVTTPLYLATLCEGKLPVIYGVQNLTDTAAYRFKTQLNENAKHMALYGVIPEIMHNEIVGLRHPEGIPWLFVFLRDRAEPPMFRTMIQAFVKHLKALKWPVEEVFSQGQSLLARILSLVALADWTSLFLALKNHEDPILIPSIKHLKRILRYFECTMEEETP
ncbi:MAG: bifunctional phosphoglucose/phosphomannose isomerase [Candidatus Caldatribacteriaceae bacterium]